MAQRSEFDVVIAGGAATGATLALALAQAGLAVAVIEARPPTVLASAAFDGRASSIGYAVFRQWRALGVGDAIEADAQPIRSVMVTEGPAPGAATPSAGPGLLRFDAEDLSGRDEGEPLGWMVENARLQSVLSDALGRAGVAVFAPAELATAEVEARAVRVRLADGRVLTAPLLVGADGRNSRVRAAAGIATTGWPYARSGLVATVALAEPHQDVAWQHFMPSGPLAVLPLTGDRASLVWTERPDVARALAEAGEDAFASHLARRFGEALGRPRLAGPRFVHPLGLSLAESMAGPRVALAGDAAHAVHPLAGQGLNLGLKDAAALAEVVVEARRLGEDWGSAAVLDRYVRWRRFDSAALALATDGFSRLFSHGGAIGRAVRAAGMAAIEASGPARRLLVREAGGAAGDLPRLLRGEALA